MPTLKNPIFINNVTDKNNGMMVQSIYHTHNSKMNKPIKKLVWQFYKNRGNLSVMDVYKKYKDIENLEINYFN
jgi:hypothetical protein